MKINLEYVGLRPIISQNGISFKQGKDDKFVYLSYVYELIDALDNNYESAKKHSYNIDLSKANIEKLYSKILKYFPNLDEEMLQKLKDYEEHLEKERNDIESRSYMSDMDKKIFITNLDLMKSYRIARAKNKIFYYYGVATIAEIIKENKIKEINIPFSEKFWHVLKTLQGVLSSQKISTSIKVSYKDNVLGINFITSIY